MATRTIRFEFPDDLVAPLGSDEAIAAKAKQALVLELLREARISQGRAAELLSLTRWDILHLMVQHRIESGPESDEELEREVEYLRNLRNP
jgi:predicted HTH domain antitoxin